MRFILSSLLLLALCATVWAQLPTATVNGTITDPQGAAVVGARIVVTSKATGATRETVSGADERDLVTEDAVNLIFHSKQLATGEGLLTHR